MTRRPVAILGATGVAGRQAVVALARHPWFEIAALVSSSRSAGRRLGDVLDDELSTRGAARGSTRGSARGSASPALEGLPTELLDRVLLDGDAWSPAGVDLVFSTLPAEVARRLEPACARTTPVVSTAAALRMAPDGPLLLAGVNGGHAELLARQGSARGWRGWVAPTPNCTTVGLAVTLAPLVEPFGVRAVNLTSMQALSGAGAAARELAEQVADNLLPWIDQEEEKVQRECVKILGQLGAGGVQPAGFGVSATCTRVAVEHGHTLSVSVGLVRPATPEQVIDVLSRHDPWAGRSLPSAPERWIEVRAEPDRPQPALDREAGGGMTTVVGRVRPDEVLGGVKYVVVSHNAVLGAAGGAVLLAEDLVDRGFLPAR